jgi:hypothetical protein
VVVVAIAAVFAVSSLCSWIAYLMFCRWLVEQSKDSSSLRDAAIAAKAFRAAAPAAIARSVAKLASSLKRDGH